MKNIPLLRSHKQNHSLIIMWLVLTIPGLYVYLPRVTLTCVHARSCLTLLRPHRLQPARLLGPWNFPGTNTE